MNTSSVKSTPYVFHGVPTAGVIPAVTPNVKQIQIERNTQPKVVEEATPEPNVSIQYDDSLKYLACCVEAEAGNQDAYGRRLVADCIINRYKTGKYKTYYDVIQEYNQFQTYANGIIDRIVPTDETYQIVKEELEHETNTEVLYFRTEHYHTFGTPCFKHGAHYFSK